MQSTKIFLSMMSLVERAHTVVKAVAPWSILISALGLVLAAYEMAESRKVREANLLVSLMERLDVARNMDSGKFATEFDREKREPKCADGPKQLRARAGQIAILERMSSLGLSLRDIKAHDVNLVVYRSRNSKSSGIDLARSELFEADLQNSNLQNADLSGAKLLDAELGGACMDNVSLKKADLTDADARRADFRGADLTGARLVGTDLSYSRFWRVNFSGTVLTNADLTGAHLRTANNLTQSQLDQACANPKKKAPTVPRGLKWKERDCPS